MSSKLETFSNDRNENEVARRKRWKGWQCERREYGRNLTYWNFLLYSIFPVIYLLSYANICKENRIIIREFGMEWAFLCFLSVCIIDILACILGILSVWNGLNFRTFKFANFILLIDTLLNLAVAFALPAENGDGSPSDVLGHQNYPTHCYNRDPFENATNLSPKCSELQRLAGYIWLTLFLLIMRTFCIVHGNYAASIARYGAFYPLNIPSDHGHPIVILPDVATFPYKIVLNHPVYRPGTSSQTNVKLTQSQMLQLDLGHGRVESKKVDASNANCTPGEQRENMREDGDTRNHDKRESTLQFQFNRRNLNPGNPAKK